jgi:hypothetical protein
MYVYVVVIPFPYVKKAADGCVVYGIGNGIVNEAGSAPVP